MQSKTADLVIAIVPRSGSREHSWHGVLQKSEEQGYFGKLLSYELSKEDVINLFDFSIPEALDKSTLYCVLDGDDLGTILWPRFGGRSLRSSSKSIEIRIPTLIRDVHIDETEQVVESVSLRSAILLPLFNVRAFAREHGSGLRDLTIRTDYREFLSFDSKLGAIKIRSSGFANSSHGGLDLKCFGILDIQFKQKKNSFDAVRLVRQIEHLFSLLCFSYIAFEGVSLKVELTGGLPPNLSEEERYVHSALERAQPYKKIKLDIKQHELPLKLDSDVPLGALLDRFLEIHARIERSLNWYRAIKIEERYVEDRFFNSVRMIEGLYSALNLDVDVDGHALILLDRIQSAVCSDSELLKFLNQRLKPIFSKTITTASVIRDLKHRYSDIKLIEILDVKRINSLRAKEAHGSSDRYDASDYQYMIFVIDLLKTLYPCLILEYCGIERSWLLQKLKESIDLRKLFEEKHLDKLKAALTVAEREA